MSQSDKLKTKMKLFYLFLYYGEFQRETVAKEMLQSDPKPVY